MSQRIVINNPSTVYVHFTEECPKLFVVRDDTGDVFYFRHISYPVPRIKFRMPIYGVYFSDTPIEIDEIVPIEIPDYVRNPNLPPPQRDRIKDVFYKYNPSLGTVARIHTDTGLIEHGPRYRSLIKPMQVFIDEHEKAHMFYLDEDLCDMLALVNFIRMGYNESTAYYTLSKVLRRSSQQMDRVKSMYADICNNIQPNFNPGE